MKEISLLLNVVVLVFEILYCTLFMKFARKEGKFWRYLLLFVINTAITLIFGFSNLLSYLIFIIATYVLLKYLVRIKVSLYDMLIIFSMMIIKLFIEAPLSLSINLFIKDIYVVSSIVGFIKVLILYIMRNKINLFYNKFRILWNNNNFYIRYIFSTFMFIYVIVSCVFIIKML